MDSKLEALISHRTWTLVPCLADANIFICKWVLTLKYHPDGTIAHHKACLGHGTIALRQKTCSYIFEQFELFRHHNP